MRNPFRKDKNIPPTTTESPATINAWDSSKVEDYTTNNGNNHLSLSENNNPFTLSSSDAVNNYGEKTEHSTTLTNTNNHHPSPSTTPGTTMMMDRNNTPESLSTKSPQPAAIHTRSASIEIPPLPYPTEGEKATTPIKKNPNKGRFFVRVWQMIAAIGAFGFQVGATPYSGHDMPFSKIGLLYYIYAICWFSFIWSLFNIYVYLTRRFGKGSKIKRPVSILMDCFIAALFGVGTFYEFAMYKCPPGAYDGWCNFFNTGSFFLVTLFATYVLQTLWDVFGGMSCLRRHD
ncbi:hypothetical protein INT45_003172 [Circinella minor]|uniref:MARVEL domain-containing protein n=1 Tax=Circinella minor TaxID=1195481 RepID=A0A8H7RRN3_9FUNG|nr:hypothetical protein INT45_003172 [Circinella minor]